MRYVVHESYTDIMGSPYLSAFVLVREPPGTTRARLPRLSGYAPTNFVC